MRIHPQVNSVARHPAIRRARAALHAARLDEDIALFSERLEDAVECDDIMRHFVALHEAEIAADDYPWPHAN